MADRPLMAKAAASLFVAGGSLALLQLLLNVHPAETNELGVLVNVVVAYLTALVLLLTYKRAPEWVDPLVASLATLVITLGIYHTGESTSAWAITYLWVGLFVFYFFTRTQAILQVAWIAFCYGAVLLIQAPVLASTTRWFVTCFTLVVAGALVGILRGRVEQLVYQLADSARTDPLTGLLNRRGFEERFDLELERARRNDSSITFLVADLDCFKVVNDRLGHHNGDNALLKVSAILDQGKRRFDAVARMGGEEFAFILPECEELEGYIIAERLRNRIRDAFADQPVPLTISFGITSFPKEGETSEVLLRGADRALYAAKRLGRDRSTIFAREHITEPAF